MTPDLNETVRTASDVTVLVADDAEVIGFYAADGGRIHVLCVDPAHQCHRGGQLLLRHFPKRERVLFTDIDEQNVVGREFLEWFGFKVTGRSDADAHQRPLGRLQMRMQIDSW